MLFRRSFILKHSSPYQSNVAGFVAKKTFISSFYFSAVSVAAAQLINSPADDISIRMCNSKLEGELLASTHERVGET